MSSPLNTMNPVVSALPPMGLTPVEAKHFVPPAQGEVITSLLTGNSYTIEGQIGEGNFGIVYACNDTWGNELAVKVLKPNNSYERVKAAAEAEFIKLVTLRHPNITYIYDAFEYRDTFYIVTERCVCSLAELFKLQNFVGTTWLMPVARSILQAVYFLHINQVVHQDIHLGNVFTTFVKDELPTDTKAIQFRVADLGVAKVFHEIDAFNTRAQWMLPPEVLRPEEFGPIDYRIDIYHTGLLLLQLACSRELTFTEDEVLAGRPRELAETLQAPLNFALSKALRRHAAFRTSDAMELWRDLNALQPAIPLES